MSDKDEIVADGIVAIGRELCDLSRHCNSEEMINISIESREKLQKAAEALGLMDRIIEEADHACNNAWRKQYGHPLMTDSNMKDRFTIVGGKEGDDDA